MIRWGASKAGVRTGVGGWSVIPAPSAGWKRRRSRPEPRWSDLSLRPEGKSGGGGVFPRMITPKLPSSPPPSRGALLEWGHVLLYVEVMLLNYSSPVGVSLNGTSYPGAVNMSPKGDGDLRIVIFQSYSWHSLYDGVIRSEPWDLRGWRRHPGPWRLPSDHRSKQRFYLLAACDSCEPN